MVTVRPLLLSLLLLWLSALTQAQVRQGFAVQVASVQSLAEAVALTNGLRARGVNSYWVRAEVAGLIYYRVRVGGQFDSNKSAIDFGRKLVHEGVVNTYTVLKYEPATDTRNLAIEKRVGSPRTDSLRIEKTPASEPVPGTAAKATSPSVAQERKVTDYLITGEPQRSSPSATPNGKPPAAANRTNEIEGKRPNEKGRLTTRTAGDEVELDDFKEFAPQFLHATVEAKNGLLVVTLQNRNTRHRFRGTVNLNLRENERERPYPAMQIEIAPDTENSFEIQGVGRDGSYLLTVYDEQRALQLMQHGTLGQQSRQSDVAYNPSPASHANPPAGGNIPPQPERQPGQIEDEAPSLRTSGYPAGKPSDENVPANEEPKNEPGQTGDVKIIVRQVAASNENITVEFEILAQQPLGMLVMAVHTTSMNDSKQAIMTTKQGRLPFLVPASDANGAISYELRDETGRLLATGSKAFQDIAK